MNTTIFFLPQEYRITLAIDSYYYIDVHILDSKLVKNTFKGFRQFLSTVFACLMSILPWVSSYGGVWTPDQAGHCPLTSRYFQPCTLHGKKTVLKLKGRRSLGPWQLLWKKPPLEMRVRSQQWDGLQAHSKGSLYVSWNLPIYPSPESTLKLASHLGQNVLLRGGEGGHFHKKHTLLVLFSQTKGW